MSSHSDELHEQSAPFRAHGSLPRPPAIEELDQILRRGREFEERIYRQLGIERRPVRRHEPTPEMLQFVEAKLRQEFPLSYGDASPPNDPTARLDTPPPRRRSFTERLRSALRLH